MQWELSVTKLHPFWPAKEQVLLLVPGKAVMVEFFRRLFATYNLYGMGVCAVFLAAWFYFSREERTDTVDLLRRRRREGPPGGQS